MRIVYLNGEYLPADRAVISVDDRGFLFADACYEATPIYRGTPFLLDRHLARLRRGLDTLRIRFDPEQLVPVHDELIAANGLATCELGIVYMHITRGSAPRAHAFPHPEVAPTVYAFAKEVPRGTDADFERGGTAITLPDERWLRPHLKTPGLLPNVLAQQAALDAGATDVVFQRDGKVTEGTHNNVFVVLDGRLHTAPADGLILEGVTRSVLLELAIADGVDVVEAPVAVDRLADAEEIFFTSATTEIRPTVELDGRPVGDGRPGPVARRLRQLLRARIDADCGPPQ